VAIDQAGRGYQRTGWERQDAFAFSIFSGESRICATLGPTRANANGQDERLLARFRRAESDEKAEIVQVLIWHGADVTARDETHSTPLHLASSKGSSGTVKLLIRHGADVNARDRSHSTPLHLAASSHLALKGNVVSLLLSHGANVGAKDDRGRTPFQIASLRGLSEIAELLSDV